MKIRLREIPREGKFFCWNTQTGELNTVLADLLKAEPHESEFFIRPLNSRDYELSGWIKTQAPEVCSRCGVDFNFKIQERFHEILIPRQESDSGRYARVNHISEGTAEGGPGAVEYENDETFDMGEYLHEVVALAIPFNPAPETDAKDNCLVCGIRADLATLRHNEEMPEDKGPNPFAVLKNFKIQ